MGSIVAAVVVLHVALAVASRFSGNEWWRRRWWWHLVPLAVGTIVGGTVIVVGLLIR